MALPRYIVTGAPGAGKTTVLRALAADGYPVVEEAATDVIAVEQARGFAKPWTDPTFIDKIVTLQRDREARSSDSDTVFFDRSPVCTLALSRYLSFAASPLLTTEIERIARDGLYSSTVFFIRQQGFLRATAARQISFDDSLDFERVHQHTYEQLGFRLIDVPAGPLADRVALIRHALTLAQRPQP